MKALIRGGRPSPAMLVSVIALVFALGGVATALPGKKNIDKNDLAKNVVKSKHIKDGGAKYKDLEKGIAVRAYAKVTGPDQVQESQSRGLADSNIDEFGGGFCIENLSFQPRHIQVTHGYTAAGDDEVNAEIPAPDFANTCNGTDAWVYIGGETTPDFYIALYE